MPQRLAGPSRLRPTLLAWPQKPLILLARKGHPNRIEHGARPQFKCALVVANEAIAENHEKNRAEAPSMRRRKMVAPGWGLAPKVRWCTESLGLYEADDQDQSQQCSRVVCKIVELTTCRRA